LIGPEVLSELSDKIFEADLYAAASKTGELFVWPVKATTKRAKEVAELSCKKWHSVAWNGEYKEYRATEVKEKRPEPDWPFADFDEMLDAAFAGRIIDRRDHPRLVELLGPEART
jgi:hypothetical protein